MHEIEFRFVSESITAFKQKQRRDEDGLTARERSLKQNMNDVSEEEYSANNF